MAGEDKLKLPSVTTMVSIVLLTVVATRIKGVDTIVIPLGLEKYFEEYGFRDFIISEIREYARQSEIRKVMTCLVSFVETYMSLQPSRIPVLLPQNSSDYLEISQIYLSALQRIRSVYVFRGELHPTWDHINTRSSLIILEDSWELSNVTFELIDLCGKDCRYLVVLIPSYPDAEAFLKESDEVCSLLWRHRVANVAFLGVVGQEVLIAKSLSFKSNMITEPTSPVLVAECDEASDWNAAKWSGFDEIYRPLKMNRSIVNVAFLEYEPYVTSPIGGNDSIMDGSTMPSTDEKGELSDEYIANGTEYTSNETFGISQRLNISRLGGFEGLILETLATQMNFVILAKEVQWSVGDTSMVDVEEILWGEDAELTDMVIGGLTWSPANETVYTLPYDVVQYVWLIPIRPNVSLHGLIAPLHKNVWYAVIGLLVFASCIEYVIQRNVAFLQILSLVIGFAWPTQPKVMSSRIRFISWVIFGYVLTQCYLASLAGQLMASSDAQIDSFRELAASSYQIGGTAVTKDLFAGTNNVDDNDNHKERGSADVSRIISERLLVFEHDEYQNKFHDLINMKNTSLALSVRMNVSSMTPSFQGKKVHCMKEAIASYPLSFAVWRGIPYLDDLDNKISDLIEGGIITLWARNISRTQTGFYRTQSDDSENNVNLLALVPGFLLLIMGYGLSAVCLVAEVVVYRWRTSRSDEKNPGKHVVKGRFKTPAPRNVTVDKKITDPLDTKAWLLEFNRRNQHSKRKTIVFPKPSFPIEFAH